MSLNSLHEAIQAVRERCPEVPLLAIPWMQMKHPIHPAHRELLGPPRRGPGDLRRAASALFSLLYALTLTARLLQIRARHSTALRALASQRFDLVAKSWRFETGEGAEGDFYYGDLRRRLQEKGLRMLTLYSYPRGAAWRGPRLASDPETWNLHEMVLLPLSAPLRLVFSQWATSRYLSRLGSKTTGLTAEVAKRAMLDCLSFRHLLQGLTYPMFKRAAEIWKPRGMLTLYEGHPWEQFAWAAAKEAHPSCKTIGYQHTILHPHQLSMLRLPGRDRFSAKPDAVLCLGPHSAEMLRPAHPGARLIPFGTFRCAEARGGASSSAGLRTAATNGSMPVPGRKTVLVLPEAHAEEMSLLFQTAARIAERLPDHHFILRCHPILPSPKTQIRSSLGRDPAEIPNLEVSTAKAVEEDFARSSVLLYRGSSSVLYAVRTGLKPVYLRERSLPDLDSLSALSQWKETAEGLEELEGILSRYAVAGEASSKKEWTVASEFVRSYAIPVDDTSLRAFLEVLA